MKNAVSQYGISKYKVWYRVQTMAYGVAGIGAAVGCAMLPAPTGLVVVSCGIFAVCRLIISWFPMDTPGGEKTWRGSAHGVLAMTTFLAVTIAAEQLARSLHHGSLNVGIAQMSNALSILMLVTLLAMVLGRRELRSYFGLIERVFYLLVTVWLGLVAVLLILS